MSLGEQRPKLAAVVYGPRKMRFGQALHELGAEPLVNLRIAQEKPSFERRPPSRHEPVPEWNSKPHPSSRANFPG